ncbi:hypothetical protein P0J00_003460 [Vibrio vulnificus]|nr:hypothetical protein [Vibrio vulnificus]EKO5193456.1 hypothetical protein [Vibrio vulnificus]
MQNTYSITIGKPVSFSKFKELGFDVNALTKDEKAIKLWEHHVEWDINLNDSDNANQGTITIYNAPETLVDGLNKSGDMLYTCKIVLNDKLVGVFEITNSTYNDFAEDTKLTLLLSQSLKQKNKTQFIKTYPRNTTHHTIVTDLIKDMGANLGVIPNSLKDYKLVANTSLMGTPWTILTKLLSPFYKFTVVNNVVDVLGIDERTSEVKAYKIVNDNLLAPPTKSKDVTPDLKQETLSVTIPYAQLIKPLSVVVLDLPEHGHQGVYKVLSCSMRFSFDHGTNTQTLLLTKTKNYKVV